MIVMAGYQMFCFCTWAPKDPKAWHPTLDREGTSKAVEVEREELREDEVDNEDGNNSNNNKFSSVFNDEFTEVEFVTLSDDENWLAYEERVASRDKIL